MARPKRPQKGEASPGKLNAMFRNFVGSMVSGTGVDNGALEASMAANAQAAPAYEDLSSMQTDDLQTSMPPEAPALGNQQFSPSGGAGFRSVNSLVPPDIGKRPGILSGLVSQGQTWNNYDRLKAGIAQNVYNQQAHEILQQQAKAAMMNQLAAKFEYDKRAAQEAIPLKIRETTETEKIKTDEAIRKDRAARAFANNVNPEDYDTSVVPFGRAKLGGDLLQQNIYNATAATPDGATAIAKDWYSEREKQGSLNDINRANTARINAEVPFIPRLNESTIRKNNATAATEEAGLPLASFARLGNSMFNPTTREQFEYVEPNPQYEISGGLRYAPQIGGPRRVMGGLNAESANNNSFNVETTVSPFGPIALPSEMQPPVTPAEQYPTALDPFRPLSPEELQQPPAMGLEQPILTAPPTNGLGGRLKKYSPLLEYYMRGGPRLSR